MQRKIKVTDPVGFEHIVLFDNKGEVWGTENITHNEPKDKRGVMINTLARLMTNTPNGEYSGYSWIEVK